jgi:hypothetical protein
VVQANSTEPAKEEMVHISSFLQTHANLAESMYLLVLRTPLLQLHTSSINYGQEILVVKLDDGTIYPTGDYLEQQKEQLVDGCH